MKNLYKHLLSGLCLILVSIPCFAKREQITIGLTIDLDFEDERPSKGNRAPAMPVICTIDFENHRIETSIPYNITAYELCDEDGDSPIVSFANDYEMVNYMANVSGVFQLRIVTAERTYVGYIDLS